MTGPIVTRRDFLLYAGATVAGVTLGELGRRKLARADERAALWQPHGEERWATSVCRECPAGCGLRARLIDGVPVRLEGNPLCPVGRGRLCAKGQASLEAYFDPDRLVGPARRDGDGGWQSVDWPSATTLLAAAIGRFSTRGGVLVIGAEEPGPVGAAWTTFWQNAGATVVETPAAHGGRLRRPFEAITGAAGEPLFDLEQATYVLSFGAPVVEDWLSPVWAQRAFGRFRRSGSRPRGRLVQIDARQSSTARKADEWIVVPGDRQTALACGIISVLLREDRFDHAFLEAHAGNFAEYETAVLGRYTPDALAAATGVPVVTILRLARELASSERPLVIVDAGADPSLAESVFALDALIGAFDRPGGVFSAGRARLQTRARLAPGPIPDKPGLVVLRDASAVRSHALPFDIAAILARAEMVVSFSPYLDESATDAHLLLPAHTPLESWHAITPARAVPGEHVAIASPAVQPRLDTRDVAEALRLVADALGAARPAGCDWATSEDLVRRLVDGLSKERRGTPYCSSYETEWIAQLERGGWWTSPLPPGSDFPTQVLQAGGWTDPFFEPGAVRQSLRTSGGLQFPMPPPLPPADVVRADREFPLRVFTFVPSLVSTTGSANLPSLLELLGPPQHHPWHVWVELNPETAQSVHAAEGSTVRLVSRHGAVDAIVVLVERMPRDSAALACLPCVPQGGRWTERLAADARALWPRGRPPEGPAYARIVRA